MEPMRSLTSKDEVRLVGGIRRVSTGLEALALEGLTMGHQRVARRRAAPGSLYPLELQGGHAKV